MQFTINNKFFYSFIKNLFTGLNQLISSIKFEKKYTPCKVRWELSQYKALPFLFIEWQLLLINSIKLFLIVLKNLLIYI